MANYNKFTNISGEDLNLQDKALRDNINFSAFSQTDKIITTKNANTYVKSLPDSSNVEYKKILITDQGTVKWDKIDFGTGSSLELLKPQMLVGLPEDFDKNSAEESTLNWVVAPPTLPEYMFDAHTPIGTKKFYNLNATVEDNTHYILPEYTFGWEETQNIPDPKTGSHSGDVLTYNGDDIVWAAPTQIINDSTTAENNTIKNLYIPEGTGTVILTSADVANSSAKLVVNYDNTTLTANAQGALTVLNPIPEFPTTYDDGQGTIHNPPQNGDSWSLVCSYLNGAYNMIWKAIANATPPSPSYTYLILNQFIDPMPTPVSRQYRIDDFTNEVLSNFNDQTNYQKDDLVSDTVGSQFLDTDSPIDFTSKGISTGTPFGLIYEHDGLSVETGIGYSIQQGDLANDFTVETWYKNYNVWFFGLIKLAGPVNEYGYSTQPSIIIELSNDNELILDFDDGDTVRFQLEYTLEPQWNDGNWHHYAISYDSTAQEFYLFYDGKKIVTIDSTNERFTSLKNALDTVSIVEAGYAAGDGSFPTGRFAQFAVCQQCKWNADFTPPTTAY